MFKTPLINLQFFLTEILPTSVVENHNLFFVNFMLITLLLASLGLTFHNKGTTVHKVLGLLLVSIFVVFIWILHTQFLFIYIVYILAFISAVLMLFLSVVLMLPISALSSTNSKRVSTTAMLIFNQYTTLSEISSSIVIETAVCGTLCLLLFKYFKNQWFSSSNSFMNELNVNSIQKHQITHFSTKTSNLLTIFLLNCKFLVKNACKNTCTLFKMTYLSTIVVLKNVGHVCIELLLRVHILYISKLMLDVGLQTYLFLSVFLALTAAFCNKKIVYSQQLSNATMDSTQGISQLKFMLYGDYSMFLIFSTVVLLIALLGAAVMTRTKR